MTDDEEPTDYARDSDARLAKAIAHHVGRLADLSTQVAEHKWALQELHREQRHRNLKRAAAPAPAAMEDVAHG